ncbi:hypothetical protein [Salinibaculum salinum]|uniref:hypothetical protein n=1 Tax=Salinibaculum salinum TaxID=3131996 RepID=UPI0030EB74B6
MVVSGLRDRIERRHLVLVGLAVLVALAGCAGGTGNGTETPANSTTPNETPTDSIDESESDLPQNASIDNYTAGESLESELTPAEELSVSGDQVASDARTAIETVGAYRLTGNSTLRTQSNNVDQSQEITRETRVNLEQSRLASNQTVSFSGQTIDQATYIVDGTLYQRSEQFVRQYNSEWVKQDISENVSEVFRTSDRLALYERMLDNGSVSLEGAQQVDGADTYRLQVRTDSTSFADVFGLPSDSVSDVAMVTTLWVDTESSTVVRAEGALEIVTTLQGQPAVVSGTFTEQFEYTTIDVSLPEEAGTAVEIGTNESAG